MSNYWGDFAAGATIRIPFSTYGLSTGASITVGGFAAADIEIYKNGGLTQRASDSGYTATTDFDNLTGLHLIVIDTGDNGDAGFFAAGSEYQVAVSSVTVDGQTVSFWAGAFSIERVSIPTAQAIADAVLKRGVVNTEATADAASLTELILAAFESSVSGTAWSIRKTTGAAFSTRTLTLDAAALPIAGVT